MNLEDKLLKILEYAPSEMLDQYAKNRLLEEMENYKNRHYTSLAKYKMIIDESEGDFYDLLLKLDFKFIEIIVDEPCFEGVWSYNAPIKKIKIAHEGLGFAHILIGKIDREKWRSDEGKGNKVMVRSYVTKYYQPITIKMVSHMIEPSPPKFSLRTLENLVKDIVTQGVVPFEIKLLIYTPVQRFSLTLDLVNSTIVSDPREGKMNPRLYKSREPMEYLMFDSAVASMNLPPIAREILEILLESEGLTLFEISHILNTSIEVAKNNLNALINRNLVVVDESSKPTKYLINAEILRNR